MMAVVGIGYRRESDDRAFLESLQLVLKYIETDLQMIGIYNTEQRLAWYGSSIENSIELGHNTRDGSLDGTVSQLMFQLTEGGLSRVITAVDTRHLTDLLRCLVESTASGSVGWDGEAWD